MKYIATIALTLLLGYQLMAQETLDLKAHLDCELFSEKKDFNKQERLEQIKKLGGQVVTVYYVKGKSNKVKSKYTGKIDLTLIEKSDLPIENLTSVLVVTEDKENGQMFSHFPHTDKNEFRIYLTDCLEK